MGSCCELKLYAVDAQAAQRAAQLAINSIIRLEKNYSRYLENNLLHKINQAAHAGGSVIVNEETAALLDYADSCYQNSDGLFDISSGILRKAWNFNTNVLPEQELVDSLLDRVGWDKIIWDAPRLTFKKQGMALDFGGVVKEYAADQSAVICLQAGIKHGLINLGGDIRIIGPHPDGNPWSIGIRNPRHRTQHIRHIQVYSGGVSTSGDYERCIRIGNRYYSHIINPKTGWPVSGIASVTVVADFCLVAGSVSTIGMLKERDGTTWLQSSGLPVFWVDIDGFSGATGMR